MKKTGCIFFSFFVFLTGYSQQIEILNNEKPTVSFRGLSVVNDSLFWLGGSDGTIGRSTNGGESIEWLNPKGYENRDFRAVYGFDDQTAIAVAVASPAVIFKTTDGGQNWKEVYRDEHPAVFLDDIEFFQGKAETGFVVGDRIDGQNYFLKTVDGGESWERQDGPHSVPLDEKEAFFAASNSNIKMIDENTFLAVSGGGSSNLIVGGIYFQKFKLPKTESDTSGANAVDYSKTEGYGLIVGGDFMNPKSSANNLFIFTFSEGVAQISQPVKAPSGYKSGVALIGSGQAISCGMLNVDYSKDKGQNWETISKTGFHACKKAKQGSAVFLVGSEGKIGKLIL